MKGILRIRVDAAQPRLQQAQMETVGGVPFYVMRLRLRREDSWADRRMMRRAVYEMAAQGVTRAAAPDRAYIKRQMERHNMAEIGHTPLLRCLAPQITDYLLQRRPKTAVALYARTVDDAVLTAAHHAARYYQTVMLDFGRWSEPVCDQLMDLYGIAALPEIVPGAAQSTAALWFDGPPPALCRRMERMISVALCVGATAADYDDLRLAAAETDVPPDTDREGMMSAVVADHAQNAASLQIARLVKK